jgi:hypothetical protein
MKFSLLSRKVLAEKEEPYDFKSIGRYANQNLLCSLCLYFVDDVKDAFTQVKVQNNSLERQ